MSIMFSNITKLALFVTRSHFTNGISYSSIRHSRNRLIQEQFKVMTQGLDNDERERVSSAKYQVKREDLAKHEKLHDYFDEGYMDEDLIGTERKGQKQAKSQRSTSNKMNDGEKVRIEKESRNKMQRLESIGHNDRHEYNEEVKEYNGPKPKLPGIPIYEKLGEDNREFLKLVTNIKKKKYRRENDLMILEGKRIINDAIEAGLKPKVIYFTLEKNLIGIDGLESLVNEKGVALKKVFYKDMKLFSDLVTCPGLMAIFKIPTFVETMNSTWYQIEDKLPITLIIDNVRDPGNLGTLIRASAAVGIQKIICIKGCVDPWEMKVVRAGAGAHFRVPIIHNLSWPYIVNHLPNDGVIKLFIADSNVDSIEHDTIKSQEASLVSQKNELIEDENEEIDYQLKRDDSYSDEACLSHYRRSPIKTSTYSDISYFNQENKPIFLIIGGETHGLSNQAYKLASDYSGTKINIPLAFGVDSLNNALSASIILYEMRRQLFKTNQG